MYWENALPLINFKIMIKTNIYLSNIIDYIESKITLIFSAWNCYFNSRAKYVLNMF